MPVINEDKSIKMLKYSFPSNILSSVIEIYKKDLVIPAGNITEYGPVP